MRLVQVLIPAGTRESVVDSLDEQGLDYALFEEVGRGDFEGMVQFPVPPSGVEPVIEQLREAGIREDAYTIVLPTETVISQRLSALIERFPGLRISREELSARAEELAPANSTFFAFLILSTIIATTGLLLDSAATIIGAMVVAPLMGPAISASVGAVLDDQPMTTRGVKLQVTGLVAAILTAAIMGWLLQRTVLIPPDLDILSIPQITERTTPNVLSLFLALGSGLAGAISIMRGSGSTLVGVAIAVALIPPAATAGLAVAFGVPGAALAAAVLVAVNLLAINLSALILFYAAGFRPADTIEVESIEEGGRLPRHRHRHRHRGAVAGPRTGDRRHHTTPQSFEQETQAELQAAFAEADIEGVELVEVTVDYELVDVLLGNEPEVNVLVGIPRDFPTPPGLAQRFDDELTERLGQDVFVQVGFIEAEFSEREPPEPPLGFEAVFAVSTD
jgi:TIGR00341 family protein